MAIQPPIVESQDAGAVSAWYDLFLQTFPEFSNSAVYPQAMIQSWIVPGVTIISPVVFGDQYNLAVSLWLAHNITLEAREMKASASGSGLVGTVSGPIASKSIDKLSIAYSSAATSEDGGAFNLTTYGLRLWQMVKGYAAGGFYTPGRRHFHRRGLGWR